MMWTTALCETLQLLILALRASKGVRSERERDRQTDRQTTETTPLPAVSGRQH